VLERDVCKGGYDAVYVEEQTGEAGEGFLLGDRDGQAGTEIAAASSVLRTVDTTERLSPRVRWKAASYCCNNISLYRGSPSLRKPSQRTLLKFLVAFTGLVSSAEA